MKALLASLLLCGAALADVQVTIHVIEMPQERAAELVTSGADGGARFKQARGFVKAGLARSYDTVVLRLVPGQKGTTESIHEHITPTEAEPPEGGGLGSGPPPAPPPKHVLPLRLPKVPESFATRNLGSSFDATIPELGKKTVDLNGEWHFAIHAGETVSEDWTDEFGNRHQVRRPTYVSFTTGMNRPLVTGGWALVSVQSSSDADGKIDPARKLVVFVKADDLHPGE
ncbi:hypothetical protein [Haloferula sp. BvORR071]|uniref:hypothetical protein n=1 Tax=Haloferula sp. BvORR071 TaxID=1396141 RepID=UPI00055422DA|nr:hypothetical protein [Haloferula sp. BvORR071]